MSSSELYVPEPEQPRESSQDRLLKMIRERYPSYHPVMAMVELAHGTKDETIELNCHKEVAKYTVAVDKFVEIKAEVKKTRRVVVELFGGPDQRATAAPVTDMTPRLDSDPSGVFVPSLIGDSDETVGSATVRSSGPVGAGIVGLWGDEDAAKDAAERFS